MKTDLKIKKVYSVANPRHIQFKVDMGDGATWSAFLDNGGWNIKQQTMLDNGNIVDCWGSCIDLATNNPNQVQSAIYCIHNGLLKVDGMGKRISNYRINKCYNQIK